MARDVPDVPARAKNIIGCHMLWDNCSGKKPVKKVKKLKLGKKPCPYHLATFGGFSVLWIFVSPFDYD